MTNYLKKDVTIKKTVFLKKNLSVSQGIFFYFLKNSNTFIQNKIRKIMLKKSILVLCIICFLTSCKSLDIHQASHTPTTQQVTLGTVGLDKDFLLQKEFNNTAIPTYKTPIKVFATAAPFNKQHYKNFVKAKALQSASVSVNYIDSISNKPKFLKLQIADKVAVIDALNSQENSTIKAYLSHNTHANILTHISIALNKKDFDAITKANAVFLIEKGIKNYALQLYSHGERTQLISFNQGILFAYKTEHCCWQENEKHQLSIVDLVSTFNNCPNKTYRSPIRVKKKMNQIKF